MDAFWGWLASRKGRWPGLCVRPNGRFSTCKFDIRRWEACHVFPTCALFVPWISDLLQLIMFNSMKEYHADNFQSCVIVLLHWYLSKTWHCVSVSVHCSIHFGPSFHLTCVGWVFSVSVSSVKVNAVSHVFEILEFHYLIIANAFRPQVWFPLVSGTWCIMVNFNIQQFTEPSTIL